MDAGSTPGTRSERFVILDGLRGVAALTVASFHALQGFGAEGSCATDSWRSTFSSS
jgi:peptidoglycan/LPS O-acetylase OafA/YrhL